MTFWNLPRSWGSDNFWTTRRRPLVAALVVAFVFAHFLATLWLPRDGRLVRGDSVSYYMYLPTLVLDNDLNFANDLLLGAGVDQESLEYREALEGRHRGNFAPIGPALLWAPFFLGGLALQALMAFILGNPSALTGYELLPQAAVLIAGICYAGFAALLTARVLDRFYHASIATMVVLTIWLATPTLYYTVAAPAYSHTTAWFAVTLGVFVWLWAREKGFAPSACWRWGLSGLAFGVAASVRQQDALFVLAPLTDLAWVGRAHWRNLVGRIYVGGAFAVGCVVGFVPQALVWRHTYGWYVGNPRGWDVFDWTNPRILDALFGFGKVGLFTWAPIVLVGTVGILLLARVSKSPVFVGLTSSLLVAIYYHIATPGLQVGTTYGARRLISANVVLALGVAYVWTQLAARHQRIPLLGAILLIVSSGVQFAAYEILVHTQGIYPTLGGLVVWLFTGQIESPVSAR